MALAPSSLRGVTQYAIALSTCSTMLTNSPRKILRHSLLRVPARDVHGATRSLSTSCIRNNVSSTSPQSARVTQDQPFDPAGGSPRAWTTSAKPDHFLNPATFSVSNGLSGASAAAGLVKHPLPNLDDSSSTASRSLLWEHGKLVIHDTVENKTTSM